MTSKIEAWFSSVGFVYMLLAGQWIGRPKDNVYTLKSCDQRGENLILDLGEGWVIECYGNISLNKESKELTIFSDSVQLLIDGKVSQVGSSGEVKFFIE